MRHLKNGFVIFTLIFAALFFSCSDGSSDDKGGNGGNTVVCTYYMKDDTSIYYVFYADKTVEYYSKGELAYDRTMLTYNGNPLEEGTVELKINTGATLLTFIVNEVDGAIVPTVELVPGFPVEYTLTLDNENDNDENENKDKENTDESGENGNGDGETGENGNTDNDSSLMFMGFENVVTIKNGTDITGITNTIYGLTTDTTLKFKGGINSITLTTVAAAMGTNDSVKIALDFSEATGITEWTNKLAGQKTLYAISLPGTVTSIQDGAFEGCSNLKAITVPKTTVELPSDLSNDIIINLTGDFWDLMKNSTVFPDEQTLYLNGEKLSDSTGSITIPEEITSIPDSAFDGCEWLTSITIPEGVTNIGNYAFKNCTNLTTITIPKTIKSFGLEPFRNCENLDEVYYQGTLETWLEVSTQGGVFYRSIELQGGWFAFKDVDFYINGEVVTDVTIPDSITALRLYAFSDLGRNLKSVTIPNTVTYFGDNVFAGCQNLTEVYYEGTIETLLTTVYLESSLVLSFDTSFDFYINKQNVTEITDVTIPNSVTTIGNGAFCNWKKLTNVTLPDGITRIGNMAFYSCENLTSITLPASVNYIGYNAFYDCDNLTTINYRGTEEQWNAIQFQNEYANSIPSTVTIVYNYTSD